MMFTSFSMMAAKSAGQIVKYLIVKLILANSETPNVNKPTVQATLPKRDKFI